jgi:hypothetical protein
MKWNNKNHPFQNGGKGLNFKILRWALNKVLAYMEEYFKLTTKRPLQISIINMSSNSLKHLLKDIS